MTVSLTDVVDSLPPMFDAQLQDTTNTAAPVLSRISIEAGAQAGPNWSALFDGKTTAVALEGANFAAGSNDTILAATLPWATYQNTFTITDRALNAAMTSINAAQGVRQLFMTHLRRAMASAVSKVELECFVGTGSGGTIYGLCGGVLALTGTYAGIARGDYAGWKSNVLANGGNARPLTISLLENMASQIYRKTNRQPTEIVCHPDQFLTMKDLCTPSVRISNMPGGKTPFSMSTADNMVDFKGIPVVQSNNCPSGKVVFLSRDHIRLKFLPQQSVGDSINMQVLAGQAGASGNYDSVPLPITVEAIPRSGFNHSYNVSVTAQLQVDLPGAHGVIEDCS
jgi:hypothetical protein